MSETLFAPAKASGAEASGAANAGDVAPVTPSANAATAPKMEKVRTGRSGPVRTSRILVTKSPAGLAALTRACRSRICGGRSRRGRGTRIILTVLDITVHAAVIVTVGPDRAGETADRCTDSRAFEHAYARNHRTSGNAAGCADCCALRNVAGRLAVRRASAQGNGAGQYDCQK